MVWGAAMVMLVFIRDLGSSLMYFGGFLAVLYVATNRLSFVTIGLALFAFGAWFMASTVSHVHARVEIWLDPFNPAYLDRKVGGSYQIAQSLFAQADGGLFGTGLGASLLERARRRLADPGAAHRPDLRGDRERAGARRRVRADPRLHAVHRARLPARRRWRPDSFSKLLAAGLTAVFALQVFVIVGGVTRVIPLTGVTLPFVSYGGSSILANFVLLALLLLVSDRARRPAGRIGRRGLR